MGNDIDETVASPLLVYPTAETVSPWFDLTQGLTSSLAWPLVVVLGLFLFHRQIVTALANMKSLKVAGTEISFERRVEEVVEQAKEIETPDKEDAEANDERLVNLMNQAAASPTGAILAAWKDLEAASQDLLKKASEVLPYESDLTDMQRKHMDVKAAKMLASRTNTANALYGFRLLPNAEIQTYENLRQLKNRATHEPEGAISVDEARSYVRIADKLTDLIRGIRRDLEVSHRF